MSIWGEIGKALNSTIKNPAKFKPLDELITDHGVQIFTSNGTFTVPKGINKIWVTAFGGGGGGSRGGGQGGDYVVHRVYPVSPLQKINITIGKGGTGRTDSAEATNGGSTIVGDLVTVLGGNASGNSNLIRTIRGANGGAGSLDGNSGKDGGNTEFALGGLGGSSRSSSLVGGGGGGAGYGSGGNGGDGDYSPGTGGNGGIGAGGGGYGLVISSSNPNKPGNGGNGGDGIVIIEW